jgi:hypothetical protein
MVIVIENEAIEETEQFEYLGSIITSNGDITIINRRIDSNTIQLSLSIYIN